MSDKVSDARSVRVLLVEDNPHVARLITNGLAGVAGRAGGAALSLHFDHAADGHAALERLGAARPDLVICDLYMPVMDGTSFIRLLRSRQGPHIPVLAVSAAGPGARAEALAAGADEFLDKPLRLPALFAAVDRLLGLSAAS